MKYEAAKNSGDLKTSLSEPTLGAQREIANYVAMLPSRLARVFAIRSVKPAASSSGTSAAAAGTAPSASAGQSSKKGPQ